MSPGKCGGTIVNKVRASMAGKSLEDTSDFHPEIYRISRSLCLCSWLWKLCWEQWRGCWKSEVRTLQIWRRHSQVQVREDKKGWWTSNEHYIKHRSRYHRPHWHRDTGSSGKLRQENPWGDLWIFEGWKFCNVIICQAEINLQSTNVYKARSVKIHPLYVKNKRDQNDIALIETSKSFDFSDKEKVSPICLPSK